MNSHNCTTCCSPIGLIPLSNNTYKMIPGFLFIIGNNNTCFHLKQECKPINNISNFDTIFNLYGNSHYQNNISYHREVNIYECPVCLENMDSEQPFYLLLLPCLHTICTNCILKLKNQCPICKNNILQNMNNNINLERSITLPISNTTHNIIEDELVRTSSCAAIERTISQLPTNNIYLHPFDSNLKNFYQNISPTTLHTLHINPSSDFIISNSPLLINVCTDKTITYNDVIIYIYDNTDNNIGYVSYHNLDYTDSNISLKHSGDLVKHDNIENCQLLYHNILFNTNSDFYFKIISLDIPCNDSTNLNSKPNNISQKQQFDYIYQHTKNLYTTDNLYKICISSQLSYETHNTIRQLCPNISASTAILTSTENTKKIHISQWVNDDCNMNSWAIILLYKY